MASAMRFDDEIRLNILDALNSRTVLPNIRQVKRKTGYHMATIKSSIDFLEKNRVLQGFGPKINQRELGYKVEVVEILQLDMSKKEIISKYFSQVKKDPHIYRMSSIIGSGNWNVLARHIYNDIESYHKNSEKNYFQAIEGLYDVIKDRQVFYETEPYFKNDSRTRSIIEISKIEHGFK